MTGQIVCEQTKLVQDKDDTQQIINKIIVKKTYLCSIMLPLKVNFLYLTNATVPLTIPLTAHDARHWHQWHHMTETVMLHIVSNILT